jgi:hypothetical protein
MTSAAISPASDAGKLWNAERQSAAIAPWVPPHEWVEYRAYMLWEAAGRPFGDDQRFWYQAETEFQLISDRLDDTSEATPCVMSARASFGTSVLVRKDREQVHRLTVARKGDETTPSGTACHVAVLPHTVRQRKESKAMPRIEDTDVQPPLELLVRARSNRDPLELVSDADRRRYVGQFVGIEVDRRNSVARIVSNGDVRADVVERAKGLKSKDNEIFVRFIRDEDA